MLHNKTAVTGDTVTFTCHVISEQHPDIKWARLYLVNESAVGEDSSPEWSPKFLEVTTRLPKFHAQLAFFCTRRNR